MESMRRSNRSIGSKTDKLATPIDHKLDYNLLTVTIIDPAHPLFGRTFPLLSTSSPLQGIGSARIYYRDDIYLKIPLSATNLNFVPRSTSSKFTSEALTDLIDLAIACEVLCRSTRKNSGPVCQHRSKTRFSKTSRSSSRG
jgi:hypothetical protein